MFNKILIPVDLAHKEQVPKMMEAALKLAGASSKISLLYVDTILEHGASSPQLLGEREKSHRSLAKEQLKELTGQFQDAGIEVSIKVRSGNTYDQILLETKEIKADLVIVMAHRPDFASYFIGTTAARVVRHADCSVMVVRD